MTVEMDHSVKDLIYKWYHHIKMNEKNAAELTKTEVDSVMKGLEPEKELEILYLLMTFRHLIYTQGESSEKLLARIESLQDGMGKLNCFYYHFFKALHVHNQKHYSEGLKCYQKAEAFLEYVEDKLERAEFHYKYGAVEFQLKHASETVEHAHIALGIFSEDPAFIKRCGDSRVLLGQGYTDLGSYEQATKYFEEAREIYLAMDNPYFINILNQNLGWLYATQNMAEEAVHYFIMSLKEPMDDREKIQTHYLLAKALFELKENTEAESILQEGRKLARRCEYEAYIYHLNILHAEYVDEDKLESVLAESIDYFNRIKLWGFVEDYAEKLANYYFDQDQFKLAAIYYKLFVEAKDKQALTVDNH